MEKTVFGADSRTHCFMISRQEMDVYQRYYQTPNARLHLLPPGIRRDRVMPEDYNSQRQQLRHAFGISSDQKLVLMVGSNFKLKGVDLAIRALAELPSPLAQQTHLWVAGQDNPAAFERLAKKLKIGERVRMLGARNDISQLMWAADALVHPAHRENTGTVLLEAMVAGLPVIASRTCGYASYIEEHEIGRVLAAPITGSSLAHALASVLTEPHQQWVEKGRLFASEDIFAMTERAAELIEQLGGES
jgi:UDP-glucose:(heptosyl)LPS alpha-1,3-glucosyltransferase